MSVHRAIFPNPNCVDCDTPLKNGVCPNDASPVIYLPPVQDVEFPKFKAQVDAIIGYHTLVREKGDRRATLVCNTPTGECFGEISCFWAEDWQCWKFGGLSQFLPKLWARLSDIGRG